MDSQERDRRRQDRLTAFREEAAPVKEALAAAGIDPTDFGRFVNRPFPGVLEPAHFDEERAVPVLLGWLPRVRSEYVKESMVRHLHTKAARGIAVEPLAWISALNNSTSIGGGYRPELATSHPT